MTELLELAARVEAASEPEAIGMLIEEAWEAMAGHSAAFRRFACALDDNFDTNAGRFGAALEARAWESAALMLVPKGWIVEMHRSFDDDDEHWSTVNLVDSFSVGRGCEIEEKRSTLSRGCGDLPRFIVAAALRARAHEGLGA